MTKEICNPTLLVLQLHGLHLGKLLGCLLEREVGKLLITSVDEINPEGFKQVYMDTHIKRHEKEAAENL